MSGKYVTCIGDARHPATWGGTVYHLVQVGRRNGFITDGWSVFPEHVEVWRWLWNVRELLRSGKAGGYQYTREFASRMLAQVPELERQGEVISTFPVFPPADCLRGPVNFYIDATYKQLFREYGVGNWVSDRVQVNALAREREQYDAADYICCMSRWAANAVVESYDIPAKKVHVVGGGANLDDRAMRPADFGVEPHSPLRLGFVGKEWRRKGLSFLLQVSELLEARGVPAEVLAAGFDPASGPSHRLLRTVGFIDKRHAPDRFADFLSGCDFGCLFSSAEAYGLSNLEFLRLGIPVITRDVGGMGDTVPDGCGHVFDAEEKPEQVADWLADIVSHPMHYASLVENVRHDPQRFGWDGVVKRMQAVWNGSSEYSYDHLRSGAVKK